MKTYCIYKLTSPSGKVYIGQTLNLKDRFWNYVNPKTKTLINNTIKKYGWDKIEKEVLFTDLSKQEANLKEIELIDFYKKLDISLNICKGGEGGITKIIYKINLNSKEIEEYDSIDSCSKAIEKPRNFVNRYLNKSITKKKVMKNGYILSKDKNTSIDEFKSNNIFTKITNNPNRKLTTEDVLNIKTLLNEGKSQRFIAKIFNVSQTVIYNIKNKKSWKFL